MATVRYRNKQTGSEAVYATVMWRLERSDDWERIDDTQVTATPPSSDDIAPDDGEDE